MTNGEIIQSINAINSIANKPSQDIETSLNLVKNKRILMNHYKDYEEVLKKDGSDEEKLLSLNIEVEGLIKIDPYKLPTGVSMNVLDALDSLF